MDLVLRPSMQKCQSPHDVLCIVKEATYGPLRLNRDVLTLLLAHDGPETVDIAAAVERLQEDELER